MLTETQIDWLEDFAYYHRDSEYFRDIDYVEAINVLIQIHYFPSGVLSPELVNFSEIELEKIFVYINEKYEKVDTWENVSVTRWKKKPKENSLKEQHNVDPLPDYDKLLPPIQPPKPYFPWETPTPINPPVSPWGSISNCGKCGIKLDKVMCYSCPHPDCPTGLGPVSC